MDKQELLRIIEQAVDEGWTALDLSNRGLTECKNRTCCLHYSIDIFPLFTFYWE
jgi:hypothetical protein